MGVSTSLSHIRRGWGGWGGRANGSRLSACSSRRELWVGSKHANGARPLLGENCVDTPCKAKQLSDLFCHGRATSTCRIDALIFLPSSRNFWCVFPVRSLRGFLEVCSTLSAASNRAKSKQCSALETSPPPRCSVISSRWCAPASSYYSILCACDLRCPQRPT